MSYYELRYPASGDALLGLDATQHGNAFLLQNLRYSRTPVYTAPLGMSVTGQSSGISLPQIVRDEPYDLIIPFSRFSGQDLTNVQEIALRAGRQPAGTEFSFDALRIISVLPGDVNRDGRVDSEDLSILLSSFGRAGMVWADGDMGGTGTVGSSDLSILLSNFGRMADGSPAALSAEDWAMYDQAMAIVPEPGTIGLLGLGLLALRRRR
jgi:hypothetical protein